MMDNRRPDLNDYFGFGDQAGLQTQSEDGMIPASCFKKFVDTLNNKFSEMIDLHKQVVMGVLSKQEQRDEKIEAVLKQQVEYAKVNTILHCQNQELKEYLSAKRSMNQ